MPGPSGSSRRQHQVRGPGLGNHFASPVKKRAPKRKRQVANSIVPDAKKKAIQDKMDALERNMARLRQASQRARVDLVEECMDASPEPAIVPDSSGDDAHPTQDPVFGNDIEMQPLPTPKPKRLVPNDEATKHYRYWVDLLPALVPPYLQYLGDTIKKPWTRPASNLSARCTDPAGSCSWSTHQVTGLLFGCTCPLYLSRRSGSDLTSY